MMDSIITGYISVRNYYCAEGRLGECLKYFKKHGFIDKDLVMIKDFTQMTHQEFKN